MKNKTLLEKFIEDKLGKHIEPARRGTPRGEKIGFPKKKLHAALLHLKNLKGGEIAKVAGISHALVRKWRTEQEFLSIIDTAYGEFLVLFVENLPVFKLEFFADLGNYNPILFLNIAEATKLLLGSLTGEQKPAMLVVFVHLLLLLRRYAPANTTGHTMLAGIEKIVSALAIEQVKNYIIKNDEKKAFATLDLLRALKE